MESKTVVTGVPTGTNTETVIGTTDAVHYFSPTGEGLAVRGVLNFTAGTGTTSVSIRCRKGANTLVGATVGPALGVVHTIAAAAVGDVAFEFLDTAPVVDPISTPSGSAPAPGNVYTITAQQTGGSAAGNVNYGTLGIAPVTGGW